MQYLDKKIAILGIGEEGRDIFQWLKINCRRCRVQIFDKIKQADLTGFDLVFRSPGFWRFSPMLKAAAAAGAEITSATKLFFSLCPAKIIGVTGTKGKGTTATLIYQMLKKSGKKVFLAGNIGKPMLSLLPSLTARDWVCLELSSFQLQDLIQSPHISVVLNITRDHLDVHADVREYRQAKSNLVRWQKPTDWAVLNADYPVSRSFARLTVGKVVWFSKQDVRLERQKIQLRGEHNLENIAAAMAAGRLAGVREELMAEAVYRFKGLQHRLELVCRAGKVAWYNDSFSTTPETAVAAIDSFSEPLTLILGGSKKGSDYTVLGKKICRSPHLKNLILIGRTAAEIDASSRNFKGRKIFGLKSMTAIVAAAKKLSRPGSSVVLSPACASFDMFVNYKDRGNQFKAAVRKLYG